MIDIRKNEKRQKPKQQKPLRSDQSNITCVCKYSFARDNELGISLEKLSLRGGKFPQIPVKIYCFETSVFDLNTSFKSTDRNL